MSSREPLPPERADRPGAEDAAHLEPARESLPPEEPTGDVAAASAAGEPESVITAGLAPESDPHAGPHGDLALPPAAGSGRLFFGLLAGPLVWGAQLQASYSLGTMNCADTSRMILHLVSLVSLLIVAAAGWTAWRAWRALGEHGPEDAGGPPGRARFMAATGTLTSAGFFLVILAQAIPSFVFPICA